MCRRVTIMLSCAASCMLTASVTRAEAQIRVDRLREASDSVEALVERVSRSVVQVVVTGYRPHTPDPGHTEVSYERGRTIGSGVVIDPDGYILTNAHVVAGAERIDVVLSASSGSDDPLRLGSRARALPARVVGRAPELDLALLAVDVKGLPALPPASYDRLRQGELVFAFGSPDGLRNSVTMGMVSAVARQAELDSPVVYVQTDAAINPGNSGGPLVNVDGELVGINTFIRSMSGGSEGLGFALPSALVALAYPDLREFGHLHRAVIRVSVQSVTPTLARGLNLATEAAFLVADVAQGSPADTAGVRVGDTIAAINGKSMGALRLPDLYLYLFGLDAGQHLTLAVQRGAEALTFEMTAVEVPHRCERELGLLDTHDSLVDRLGVLGIPIDDTVLQGMPGLRSTRGVLVTARVESAAAVSLSLNNGDVIRAVNNRPVATPADLNEFLSTLRPREAIVLQVERNGQLTFLAWEGD